MTLLAASALRRTSLAAPYNSDTYLSIPTPDGSGVVVHPSVLDMQVENGGPWNGYRYWMGFTPYFNTQVSNENPCIAASNDKLTWVVPAGLTNPIDTWPGGAGYNSDAELVFDPETGTLYCYWRDYKGGSGVPGNLVVCYSKSTDGSTWTAQTDSLVLTFPGAGFSPAILRMGASDWRMWQTSAGVRTATSPEGPWSADAPITVNGRPLTTPLDGIGLWHWGMRQWGGVIYGLACDTNYAATYAMSSTDGLSWSRGLSPIMSGRPGLWDPQHYRSTLTISNSSYADVWYGGKAGPPSWRVGHTRIPLSAWPEPPA